MSSEVVIRGAIVLATESRATLLCVVVAFPSNESPCPVSRTFRYCPRTLNVARLCAEPERLAAGLDAAARLVLLDVLSEAAGEITRDLAPGSVDDAAAAAGLSINTWLVRAVASALQPKQRR